MDIELDISLHRRESDGTQRRRTSSHEKEACNQDNSGNNIFYEADVRFQLPRNGHDKHFKFNAVEEFLAERMSPRLSMGSADQSKGLHGLTTNANALQNRPIVEMSANLLAASSCINTQRAPRRFSFFSSKCGSTVDAADIGDLVPPGDSFYSLFETGPTKDI
jgi:hypothetical protein